jgi:hypothetical protein
VHSLRNMHNVMFPMFPTLTRLASQTMGKIYFGLSKVSD